ncbi:hypothetical protein [Paenibacillus ferrarius]|uniref:hypothetical protein n=1 Tax=Paenibacillus ferrarius TaxID=1469647 RepID=UPI001301EA8E|nr:hypothetical protein [Paenibacillus ferrarius]
MSKWILGHRGEITKLRDLGNEEYSRLWGIDFPETAYQRLTRAKEFIKMKDNDS